MIYEAIWGVLRSFGPKQIALACRISTAEDFAINWQSLFAKPKALPAIRCPRGLSQHDTMGVFSLSWRFIPPREYPEGWLITPAIL
jgi:hypothetical protein